MNCRVVSEEDEVNDNQRQYRELNWLVSLYVIADDDGHHNRTIYIHKKSRLARLQVGTLILYDVKTMFLLRWQTLEMAGKINLHHE